MIVVERPKHRRRVHGHGSVTPHWHLPVHSRRPARHVRASRVSPRLRAAGAWLLEAAIRQFESKPVGGGASWAR